MPFEQPEAQRAAALSRGVSELWDKSAGSGLGFGGHVRHVDGQTTSKSFNVSPMIESDPGQERRSCVYAISGLQITMRHPLTRTHYLHGYRYECRYTVCPELR